MVRPSKSASVEATLPVLVQNPSAEATIPPAESKLDAMGAAGSLVKNQSLDFLGPPKRDGDLGTLGHYRVLRILGAGGMGMVFEAEDAHLQRRVALKVMKPELSADDNNRLRFLREARATAAIEHDHIVAIYEVGEHQGVVFIAMPLLKGQTLDDYLKQGKNISLRAILKIGRQTAEGLAAAHEKNLIHRDIKPSNLWIEPVQGGRVKIVDFGLARNKRGSNAKAQLTQTGAILGTPAYMAPEQSRSDAVDHRCDLFSLGCVLYRLTTSRLPFQGADMISLLTSLALDNPTAPRQVNPDIPQSLSDLIMKLLNKSPDDRPASAREVVASIRQIERELADPSLASVMVKQRPQPALQEATSSSTQVLDSRKVKKRPRSIKKATNWVPFAALGGGLAAILILALALGPIIFKVESEEGTVVITSFDPNMVVTVKRNGKKIEDYRLTQKKLVTTLQTGDIEVTLKGQHDGISVSNGKFTLTQGQTVVVTIERRIAAAPNRPFVIPKKVIPKKVLPNDRQPEPKPKPQEVIKPKIEQDKQPNGSIKATEAGPKPPPPSAVRNSESGVLAVAPNGDFFAQWESGRIHLFDSRTLKSIRVLDPGSPGVPRDLQISSDSKYIACAVRPARLLGGPAKIWECATGNEVATIKGEGDAGIARVAFLPDNVHIATASFARQGRMSTNCAVSVWNFAEGLAIVKKIRVEDGAYFPYFFHATNDKILFVRKQPEFHCWLWKQKAETIQHTMAGPGVVPGKELVIGQLQGHRNGIPHFWITFEHPITGKQALARIDNPHTIGVYLSWVHFTSDARLVFSMTGHNRVFKELPPNGSISLWDFATGKRLWEMSCDPEKRYAGGMSADGSVIVVAEHSTSQPRTFVWRRDPMSR